jgi:hypothetical protein
MADIVKELFNKKFTLAEIKAGIIYSFTTNATTAMVIKDLEASTNSLSATKIKSTATAGLTSDFAATPSKFSEVAIVTDTDVNGATGSAIVDVNSTFSIRVPATEISYTDVAFQKSDFWESASTVASVRKISPSVDGLAELPLATTQTSSTSYSAAISNEMIYSNTFAQHQFFVENTNYSPVKKLATRLRYNGINGGNVNVGEYDGTTFLLSVTTSYGGSTFDGRFIYKYASSSTLGVYDITAPASVTMTNGAAASRALTSHTHFNIDFKTEAGGTKSIQNPTSNARLQNFYFTDNQKRYLLTTSQIHSAGLTLFELPNYNNSETGGGVWKNSNVVNVPTSKSYQLGSTGGSQLTNVGPNSDRWNTARGMGQLVTTSDRARAFFGIGTSAKSTSKRPLWLHNGVDSQSGGYLHFFIADMEKIHQGVGSQTGGEKEAYSATVTELSESFGWATQTQWSDSGSVIGRINTTAFQNLTGSSAIFGMRSQFHLDQDVFYFTNIAANGTGEGPIIAWNLITNKVSAPILWSDYKLENGNAIPNPARSTIVGHLQTLNNPTDSQIAARTYTKEPVLGIRATGIIENRA